MRLRPLGKTGISVPPIGYGAFKIGRNVGTKYPTSYDLPSDDEATRLLNGILDIGIQYIDTAPAYGMSEERIGRALAHRRPEFILSTKVGERFENGFSTYDFSPAGVLASLSQSLKRLRTTWLDLVFLHSDGNVEERTRPACVDYLVQARSLGIVHAIGMSPKTVDGARKALAWADAIMVEYKPLHTAFDEVMCEAAGLGVGVIVKKGLASGRLPAQEAIPFVLSHPAVSSLVIGGLDLEHLKTNVRLAE